MLNHKIVAWGGHITLEPVGHEVVVTKDGYVVARSEAAMFLVEGGGDPPGTTRIPEIR